MAVTPVRIVVVDDSPLYRGTIRKIATIGQPHLSFGVACFG